MNCLKKVSAIEGLSRREKPVLRWNYKLKEYMHERADRGGRLEQARREYVYG